MAPGLTFLRSSWPSCLLAAATLCSVTATGCSSNGSTEVSVTHPTMIEVSPDSLLGAVPCTEGGGLQRYVATLFDVTTVAEDDPLLDDEYPGDFALPSSAPTPCRAGIGFGFVVPGREYKATVAGYDTTVLSPRAPGSAEMVDVVPEQQSPRDLDDERRQIAAGNLVTPKWTTTCSATVAVYQTVVQAVCEPFTAIEGGDTELRLNVPQLLGPLQCGTEAGQVERFELSVDVGEPEPRTLTASCDATNDIVLAALPARASARVFVSAFSADSTTPLAGAECQGVTFQSASVTARCAQLNELGTLRVDFAQALAASGFSCDAASVLDIELLAPGKAARSFAPPDCLRPFDVDLPAGAAAVTLTVTGAGTDPESTSLTCGGEVVPGRLLVAACEPNSAP